MDADRARRDYRIMAFTQRTGAGAVRGVMAPGVMAPGRPGPPRTPRPRGWFRRGLRRALREPFTRRTGRECLNACVSLLVAIPLFAFTAVAVAAGLALSVSFAGLPLLALSLRTARRLGAACRRRAHRGGGAGARAPAPVQAEAGTTDRGATAVPVAARLRGLDPIEPGRPGRLAGVRLPAAQAPDRAHRRHRADLHRGLGDRVRDVSRVVGTHSHTGRARRYRPGARVDRMVDTEPGARRPVVSLAGGLVRAGPGPPVRPDLVPLDGHRVQRPRPEAGRPAADPAGAGPGTDPGKRGGRLGRTAAPDRTGPSRRGAGADGGGRYEARARPREARRRGQRDGGRNGGPDAGDRPGAGARARRRRPPQRQGGHPRAARPGPRHSPAGP